MGNFIADNRADDAMDVFDGQFSANFLAFVDRRFADVEQACEVERLLQAVVLIDLAIAADFGPDTRAMKDVCEIQPLSLPMRNRA